MSQTKVSYTLELETNWSRATQLQRAFELTFYFNFINNKIKLLIYPKDQHYKIKKLKKSNNRTELSV